ncbi:MAG: cytochrome C oxidase subunit I [Gammaproteobacteria bacterium HGW-Gammaproteobacteria-8]|nr:MAG: cytochrome C oxidase subunit I [Gammaproteobacteria bacterium HGW-Gammaproteobacteria-8]
MSDTTMELTVPRGPRNAVLAYLSTTVVVLLLMMVLGLLMRLEQAGAGFLGTAIFYQVLTAHGAGMVGIAAIGASAVMWYFLRRHVELSTGVFVLNLALFLLGAVLILGGIFIGGFGGAWTFLYPLPRISMGLWSQAAAASFLLGLLAIGVGFLLLYIDIARAFITKYGGLGRSLGLPQLFGRAGDPPPPAVVASTMVLIVNTLAIVAGATILIMSLINLYQPGFEIDALWAKNLTYFFGHVFINATIYMAVIAVYEILPRYTGRPWKVSRVFLAGWAASTVMVLIVYPHHLLMDFAQPVSLHVLGQVISYTSGLPVLLVTAWGALTNVYRSGIRWDIASGFVFLGVFGWAAGVIPAIIDATIAVNSVMHNTLWVPGHFHFYLLLGMLAMVFGFMAWLTRSQERGDGFLDRLGFWTFTGGSLALVAAFLCSGAASVPRRFAVHLPEWIGYAQFGSIAAALVTLGALLLTLRFVLGLRRVAANVA